VRGDDPRAAYWNTAYRDYWKARVAEAGPGRSEIVPGDARTEADEVYARLLAHHPLRPGTALDVGCAWGRLFPLLMAHGVRVTGVDISRAMVDEARAAFAPLDRVDEIREAVAEALPFGPARFDNVVCFGTFDATHQHRALAEFVRVLRPGGRLYLTGKGDAYAADDRLALDAEAGARRKGHPNAFTDLGRMCAALTACGAGVVASYHFPRRGDFAAWRHSRARPGAFYEWLLVVEVGCGGRSVTFAPFSSEVSRTFRRVRGEAVDG
jgi:SAM-dependent methyltransferase